MEDAEQRSEASGVGLWRCEPFEPKLKALFKKPGGVAAAGGVWETQSATELRVVSFQ